jgi:ATP-dependent RNA helicase DDX27
MMMEDDDERKEMGSMNASIRSAKKAARPPKIGEADMRTSNKKPKSQSKKRAVGKPQANNKKGSSFARDLGQKREGARAKKGDAIAGMGKKKGGKRKG